MGDSGCWSLLWTSLRLNHVNISSSSCRTWRQIVTPTVICGRGFKPTIKLFSTGSLTLYRLCRVVSLSPGVSWRNGCKNRFTAWYRRWSRSIVDYIAIDFLLSRVYLAMFLYFCFLTNLPDKHTLIRGFDILLPGLPSKLCFGPTSPIFINFIDILYSAFCRLHNQKGVNLIILKTLVWFLGFSYTRNLGLQSVEKLHCSVAVRARGTSRVPCSRCADRKASKSDEPLNYP